MRAEFHERYRPLVEGCKTPGEAALRINQARRKQARIDDVARLAERVKREIRQAAPAEKP